MKNLDLSTPEKRLKAIQDLELEFITKLNNHCKLSEDVICRISENQIEIGINPTEDHHLFEFASEISLYSNFDWYLKNPVENKINFGSAGAFTPNNKGSYWRTMHAAEVLQVWDTVSELVNQYCANFRELRELISNQSK